MKLARFVVAAAAGVLAAAILSGCVAFLGEPTAKQVAKKPRVAVAFKVCSAEDTGGEDHDCPRVHQTGAHGRLLVAFRVPTGTSMPTAIKPKAVEGAQVSVRLTRSASYTAQLNQLAPRRDGFRWFGYGSDELTAEELATGNWARFKTKLGVPKRLVGKRFRVAPVVGAVEVDDAHPVDAPVDCNGDPFLRHTDNGHTTHCISDPRTAEEVENLVVKVKRP